MRVCSGSPDWQRCRRRGGPTKPLVFPAPATQTGIFRISATQRKSYDSLRKIIVLHPGRDHRTIMAGPILKKRSRDDVDRSRPAKRSKKVKKQLQYHSSSEDEGPGQPDFQPVNLNDDEDEDDAVETNIAQATLNAVKSQGGFSSEESGDEAQLAANEEDNADMDEVSEQSDSNHDDQDLYSDSETSTQAERRRRKRNDPDAFATSISKMLGSKLSTAKRTDPVLSRSRAATEIQQTRIESKLEEKAKRKLREDKKNASERGRVRDVLAGEEEGCTAQEVAEREKRLRKTAQRGVVKLFNAFAAAHRKAEEVSAEARKQGVVGIDQRKSKVQSMSKEAFLDLVASGGKNTAV